MTNVLNNIIANQPIKPAKQAALPAFTFDAEGKIKPLDDKAKLLPSRIFGSPIEYAKDLKQDIVNIGRAAKGKANDHELGRINDVAMKLGALGLASYLFVKNPLKLSKTMEFVGLGTFFGSMALWPKLAIQAPIKARTGVDVHQKYVDSQGRKKMLHQDPQYDLTDLYSREDLDKMGKKLGVSENLPDRDSFIKQRAKKTATQANTLWMMTAGFATPLMSAFACNRLEKPLTNLFEKIDLSKTEKALAKAADMAGQAEIDEKVIKFLDRNAGKKIDGKLAEELAELLVGSDADASLLKTVQKQISGLKANKSIDMNFVTETLGKQDKLKNIIASLTQEQSDDLARAIATGETGAISKVLAQAAGGSSKTKQTALSKSIKKALDAAKPEYLRPTVSEHAEGLRKMAGSLAEFASGGKKLGKFVEARVGDKSGTYIANQWQRVCDSLFKSMKLTGKDLKALSNGDKSVLNRILTELAKNENGKYDEAIGKLLTMVDDFDGKAGASFLSTVAEHSGKAGSKAAKALAEDGFDDVARLLNSAATNGSVKSKTMKFAADRASGARSSFYRLAQSLGLYKRIQDGSFQETVRTLMGSEADDVAIEKMVKLAKKIMLESTDTVFVEKLQTTGFEKILGKSGVTPKQYEVVMKALFGEGSEKVLQEALEKTADKKTVERIMGSFKGYQDDFMTKVVNYTNPMKPKFAQYTAGGATSSTFGKELMGKKMTDFFKETARKSYNSQKWFKIFGGALAALTAVTLVAGLAIGRKGKMEKQVEAESNKVNG